MYCKIHGEINSIKVKDRKQRCSKCVADSVTKRRKKIKNLAIKYKGGSCQECGYNKSVAALEFHHLNPLKKDFAISQKGATRSWERVKLELDKCILVCSNCHAEIHEKLRNKSTSHLNKGKQHENNSSISPR